MPGGAFRQWGTGGTFTLCGVSTKKERRPTHPLLPEALAMPMQRNGVIRFRPVRGGP